MLLVAEPVLGAEEKAALAEVIESGWITMGERVRTFEQRFAALHDAQDAVAVSSCTAGLHLILAAMGIGPGDEVLVPSLTFVATVNCVLYVGATPVFVDVEALDRPLICPADAAAKVTPRTKAAIVMHYGGCLVDREVWQEFGRLHGVQIVEDAAHAAGAHGVGKIGDASAFSFYGNKNMTTAEGGMVAAREPALLERMRQMRGHGLTTGTFQRLTARTVTYDVTMLGFNYRLDELRAAIGLCQLSHLMQWNAKRNALTQHYMALLAAQCPDVVVPYARHRNEHGHSSSHHIMPIVLPSRVDRQSVVERLRDASIQTTMHYPPAHMTEFYRSRNPDVGLAVTEEYARREVTLPLHPSMDLADVERVVETLVTALHTCGLESSAKRGTLREGGVGLTV